MLATEHLVADGTLVLFARDPRCAGICRFPARVEPAWVPILKGDGGPQNPRDHVLYSMVLGTGLRLRGLLGLNVGDINPDGRRVRR